MMSRFGALVLSVSVLASGGLIVSDVGACGNGVEHERNPVFDRLASAESALRSGEHQRAALLAQSSSGDLRAQKYVRGASALRAARVMALVIVRTEGAWLKGGELVAGDAKERAGHLAWAVTQLRLRSENAPKTASYKVDLGEALAMVAKYRTEARQLLEGLANAKLIHSPHAYAALAELRDASGDHEGARKARMSCEDRARDKSVCAARAAGDDSGDAKKKA